MTYLWQQKNWPTFQYDTRVFQDKLLSLAELTGKVNGLVENISKTAQTEIIINLMVSEAIKTSEIEGDYISRVDVVSSVRKNLGLTSHNKHIKDKRAKGIADLMTEVRNTITDFNRGQSPL